MSSRFTACVKSSNKYSKVRWFALTPAKEYVLHLFEPLRSCFLSLDKYSKITEFFLTMNFQKFISDFLHIEACIFYKTIQNIESKLISATNVSLILNDYIVQYKYRFKEKFIPLTIETKLSV